MTINLAKPSIVTMEGEYVGFDQIDSALLNKGFLTEGEIDYLTRKYPELMGGFWSSLTKIAKKIPGVGTVIDVGEGIADELRGKKKSGSDQAALLQQQLALQQQKTEQTKKYLMIGIPAALALFLLLRR